MSTHRRIYLDHNATSPLIPAAAAAMTNAMKIAGNPSSIHAEGRAARDVVERARGAIAALMGRPREQVVLTSGGTEANAVGVAALAAAAERRGLPRIAWTTLIEHPSLAAAVAGLAARGWTIRHLDPLRGHVVTEPAGLVAVARVNHELGTLYDVAAWARACGALLHVDAVQAAGSFPLAEVDADALAISAHKLGGPMGSGAVALAIDAELPDAGGHQERGRRGGTENVIGIAGFGAAASVADPAAWPAVAALGEQLEVGLRALPDVRIHGADRPRIGGTINAGFGGAHGEAIVMALDLAGIAASTGAACTSGSVQPSPVLLGLGYPPDQAREAVRFSLGRSTTTEDIETVLARLPAIVARARKHR